MLDGAVVCFFLIYDLCLLKSRLRYCLARWHWFWADLSDEGVLEYR